VVFAVAVTLVILSVLAYFKPDVIVQLASETWDQTPDGTRSFFQSEVSPPPSFAGAHFSVLNFTSLVLVRLLWFLQHH